MTVSIDLDWSLNKANRAGSLADGLAEHHGGRASAAYGIGVYPVASSMLNSLASASAALGFLKEMILGARMDAMRADRGLPPLGDDYLTPLLDWLVRENSGRMTPSEFLEWIESSGVSQVSGDRYAAYGIAAAKREAGADADPAEILALLVGRAAQQFWDTLTDS